MELNIKDSKNSLEKLPKDTIISIRAGNVRRQAPINLLCQTTEADGSHKLKFPKPVDTTESLKIDVLKPLYRGSLILVPGEKEYQLEFDVDSSNAIEYSGKIDCTMSVCFGDGLENNGGDPQDRDTKQAKDKAEKQKYDDSANQARDYLDQKAVLKYIQQLLKETLTQKPEEPLMFMWKEIGKSISEKIESSEEFKKALQQAQQATQETQQAAQRELKKACDKLADSDKKMEDMKKTVDDLMQKASDVSKASFEKLAKAEEREKQLAEKLQRYAAPQEESAMPIAESEAKSSESPEMSEELKKKFADSNATLDKAEKDREAMAKEVEGLKNKLNEYSGDRKRYEESLEKLDTAEKQRAKLEETVSQLEAQAQQTMPDSGELSEKALSLEQEMGSLRTDATNLKDQLERVLSLRRKEEEARARVDDKGVNPIEEVNSEAMNRTLFEFEESRKYVEQLEKQVEEQIETIKTLRSELVDKVDKSQIMMEEAQKQFPEITPKTDPNKNHQPIEKSPAELPPRKSQELNKKEKKLEEPETRHENAKQLLREKFQEKEANLNGLIEQAFHGYQIEKNTKQALAAAFQHIIKTDGNLDVWVQKAQTAVNS